MSELLSFGDWVRKRRLGLDLTQAALARQVGCAAITVQKIELDERRPSRQMAVRLAECLKIPSKWQQPFVHCARGDRSVSRLPDPTQWTAVPEPEVHHISRSHNLPEQLSNIIGREKEIAKVKELLETRRMVTLTGSGGVGKTRLATQVGLEILERFADGVWWIDLVSLTNPELVAQTAAVAMGISEEVGNPALNSIVFFLRSREALLILDNCEHLLEACGAFTGGLLRSCPQVKILVSSRVLLGVEGEAVLRVPSLTYPDPSQSITAEKLLEYSAIRLFVDRARLSLPDYQVTVQNASALARICQRLDGIPLAIELAAARLIVLTANQLVARLDDAFHVLTGGRRTALPRHQTLRATIDWSYNLLSEKERMVLRRLSVFTGGSTLEASEVICAGLGIETDEILDTLSSLVNKSIVNAERRQGVETRYRLLETVRQYAREKLDEAKESQIFYDRHLDYFLAFAKAIEPQLRTAIALERLQALHRVVDNLRAALSWALDDPGRHKIEAGLCLASALLYFWHTQNFHNDGYHWLKKGLSPTLLDLVDPGVRAKACFSAGHLILPLGRPAEARQWFQDSLDLYRRIEDQSGMVMTQSMLGEVAAWSGSYAEARELGEASLAMCRSLNDTWLLAWVLCRLGMIYFDLREDALARPLLEESLRIFEHLGDPLQVGDHFIALGALALKRGDLSEASAYYKKALTDAQTRQSKWTEACVLRHLSMVAYVEGEYQEMRFFLQKSVLIGRENLKFPSYGLGLSFLGTAELNLAHPEQAVHHFKESLHISTEPKDIVASLIGIARVALLTNQSWSAAQLLGACQRHIQVEDIQWKVGEKEYEYAWAETKSQLDGPAFERALSEGQTMGLNEAVQYALSISVKNSGG